VKSESLAYDEWCGQFVTEYDPENREDDMRLLRDCFMDRIADYLEAGELDDMLLTFADGINTSAAFNNYAALGKRLAKIADKDARTIREQK